MQFIKSLLIGIVLSLLIVFLGFTYILSTGFAGAIFSGPILIVSFVLAVLVIVGSIVYGKRFQTGKVSASEQLVIKRTVLSISIICVILIMLINIRVFTVQIPNLIHKPFAQSQLKEEIYAAPTYIPSGLQYKTASFYQPGKSPSYLIYYSCNNNPDGLRIVQYFAGDPDYPRIPVSQRANESIILVNGFQGFYEETWFSSDLLIDTVNNLRIDLHLYDKDKCGLQNPKEELIKMSQSMKHQ